MPINSLTMLISFSLFHLIGLSIWIGSCIILIFIMLVQNCTKLCMHSLPFRVWVIRVLNKLQILFTCSHSHSKCFGVSVWLHLGHLSVCIILYFLILTCVKKSLCISLKYMFLSFGFLQLLQNLVMFSPSKLSIPNLFLTSRTSIFFSAFFNLTCSSLTVMVFKFFWF